MQYFHATLILYFKFFGYSRNPVPSVSLIDQTLKADTLYYFQKCIGLSQLCVILRTILLLPKIFK